MSTNIVDRLRCRYPVGPMIDGKPECGYRDFSGPVPPGTLLPTPVMLEAANEIELYEKRWRELLEVTAELHALRQEVYQIGRNLQYNELDTEDIIQLGETLVSVTRFCPNCHGEGVDGDPEGGAYPCERCGGSGLLKPPSCTPTEHRPAESPDNPKSPSGKSD